MLLALAPVDYAVVVGYFTAMVAVGWYAARRPKSDDEYFLAGRSLPWAAVGMSIIATLLSSLTYLSEPGEVWQSGLTNLWGKAAAVLLEMILVWVFLIPFLMRFRFTSAYEYLGVRFGPGARWLGVGLFTGLVVAWMGFVVLAMATALAHVTGVPLAAVIATVGLIATGYTAIGGFRAVVWTEVAQVGLMLGGCLLTIGYVIWATGAGPAAWLRATDEHLAESGGGGFVLFSLDPFQRTSVLTFGLMMFVWHLCTHAGNQMTVQRYFSSSDARAARRSFATAVVFSILINGLLVAVGLALLYFYRSGHGTLGLDPRVKRQADLIFPTFMVEALPPGLTGAVLTAVLAAAMSTIDSAINALATVWSVERRRIVAREKADPHAPRARSQVSFARGVTLAAGLLITLSAYGLDRLVRDRNIVEMMPRTFNCFVVPMGGMFLLGMFLPFCGGRAAVGAALAALFASVSIAYGRELYGLERDVSFTWVLPAALAVMVAVAVLLSLFDRPDRKHTAGLTWFTRHERPAIDPALLAPEVRRDG